ncbi:hypothetical protein BDU57DRAFT_116826 [Ampelomyces quisqualis]|uniref:Uncharacterized protein n=1 Tax=Ampelomyces quisqualis TaxID=50730 RepID=A0A6A5QVN5_AMPQU|nr:hypothetical protein BDU57DRAFT_116826 [Ampelomyces quisqualis]
MPMSIVKTSLGRFQRGLSYRAPPLGYGCGTLISASCLPGFLVYLHSKGLAIINF